MFESTELITQQRTLVFASTDPAFGNWSAQIDDAGLATVTYSSIEGMTMLRFPIASIEGLTTLTTALAAASPPVQEPTDSPEEQ